MIRTSEFRIPSSGEEIVTVSQKGKPRSPNFVNRTNRITRTTINNLKTIYTPKSPLDSSLPMRPTSASLCFARQRHSRMRYMSIMKSPIYWTSMMMARKKSKFETILLMRALYKNANKFSSRYINRDIAHTAAGYKSEYIAMKSYRLTWVSSIYSR